MQKLNIPSISSVVILLALTIQCKTASTQKFTLIFDGKTFTGWEGNKDFFRIEDEAIVAGALDRQIPTNQFLCTEDTYEDFELELQVKFTSQENNAGIQIRTERIPNHHEVIGYQSDIGYAGGESVWGSLYDESRRKKFMAEADQNQIKTILKPDSYNDYRIHCVGNTIQHWINGTQVLDYTEEDEGIAKSGVICVQIHGGKPAEAWYRGIRLKTLDVRR